MRIITVAHQKGGVGKSTLVLNLAYCLAESRRVAVVDTDPQGSINDLAVGNMVQTIDLVDPGLVMAQKLTGYDFVVIDTPPYLTSQLAKLFALSDYVLIPTKTGIMDVMAIRRTIELLQSVMDQQPRLKAGIVLSMVNPLRNSLTAEVKEALEAYALPLLPTMIHQRVSFARSPMTAGVVSGSDEKAIQEVINLTSDILTQLMQ